MFVYLRHDRKVYPNPSKTEGILAGAFEGDPKTVVLSFRSGKQDRIGHEVRGIDATRRFLDLVVPEPAKYVFLGVVSDTPLSPIILWDMAHAACVGSRFGFAGDADAEPLLTREYFQAAFASLGKDDQGIRWFEKIAQLDAEIESGLNEWTFGIPTGGGDATILNKCVERILEIDVPRKEILLCGRPGDNFKYWDHVRIVGEDIKHPPLRIGEKKNRIAQEARYANLCIIHDRVFLPRNFYEVVKSFGDFYPLTTLQSLWFDDKHNFAASRYSDAGITHTLKGSPISGLGRDLKLETAGVFSPATFSIVEQSGFFAANARRYSHAMYPTGSLYLCKRSVWRRCPQSELLHWIEFEDVEHAYRAFDHGIPSRINPHGVTQTMLARPLLNNAKAGGFIESRGGLPVLRRFKLARLPLLKRKPAVRTTPEEARAKLAAFAKKWCVDGASLVIPQRSLEKSRDRLQLMLSLVEKARFNVSTEAIEQFLLDFEKSVQFDQMPYSYREHVKREIASGRQSPTTLLIEQNWGLAYTLVQRPSGEFFCEKPEDYFVKKSPLTALGTLLSSISLRRARDKVLYLPGGIFSYARAIWLSTPFA